MFHCSVIFFGQAPVGAEPGEGALDNPAPGVDAEIGFPPQHVRRFFDPDAVALGQMRAKDAVNRTVNEDHLHLAQQLVHGGYLVPEGDGGGPVHGIGRQHPAGQHVAERIGQHQPLTPFDQLARVEAHRGPGGRGRVFHALRIQDYGCGAGFFWPVLGSPPSGRQALTRAQVPSVSHLSKYQYAVPQGGKSLGTSRQTQPFLSTYKMALTISTSGHLLRRFTTNRGSKRCQSRAQRSELYAFRFKIAASSIWQN